MPFDFQFDNWPSLSAAARACRVYRSQDDPVAAAAQLAPWMGARPLVRQSQSSRNTLHAMSAVSANQVLVLFDGIDSFGQGVDINNSYFSPPNENPGGGENVALARMTLNSSANILTGLGFPEPAQVLCLGYSAGAASALYVGKAMYSLFPRSHVRVLMLNSPRPAVREYDGRSPGVECLRFHTYTDPVQVLPLHSDESIIANLNIARWRMRRADRYEHVGWAVGLDAEGGTHWASPGEPLQVPSDAVISLAGWATGVLFDPSLAHSLELMISLLSQAEVILPDFPHPWRGDNSPLGAPSNVNPPAPAPPEPLGPDPRQRAAGGDPNPQPVAQAVAQWAPMDLPTVLQSPDVKPFYAQRVGATYWVFSGGIECFSCSGRAEARRRAANLNSVCRTLAASGAVDVNIVRDALAYYSGWENQLG